MLSALLATLSRPAQLCRSSISLDHAPQPCTISALPAKPPKPVQHCTIFTLQGRAPKACQAGHTHTHTHTHTRSRRTHTHTHTHTHTRSLFCLTTPPKSVKPGIHRQPRSPLRWPAPFRHAKPTLQRPATSPQLKASTQRPMGHHPPSTCHRKAPNLLKRHRQVWMLKN
jgi:hypothetical protein